MIRVVFDKDGFEAEGHADFDEYGRDIVCAAVSSILQHSAYILREVGARVEKSKGRLKVEGIPDDECASKVLKVTIASLKSIERRYPESLKVEVI